MCAEWRGRRGNNCALGAAMPFAVDSQRLECGTAFALAETGRYEDAITILQNVVARRSDDQTSMRVLAEMYTGMREWESARFWYEKAVTAGNDPSGGDRPSASLVETRRL